MWKDFVGSGESRSTKEKKTAFMTVVTTGKMTARKLQYSIVQEEESGGIQNLAVFEGDIVLGSVADVEEASRRTENGIEAFGIAIRGAGYRWEDGVVIYEIDPALPNQERVVGAIEHWISHTRIRFRKRTIQRDYVVFRSSNGCSSSVGRQGGRQYVNLGEGCTVGNTIHEIGHTVGLWHEQSRSDRDQWIKIDLTNIVEGLEHNFDQQIQDGEDLGTYDYDSIMHYPTGAFAKDPVKPTIIALKAGADKMGQREALSQGDINAITAAYAGITTPG